MARSSSTIRNAAKVRDVLGTVLLALLAEHRRGARPRAAQSADPAHITGLRKGGGNPTLRGHGQGRALPPGLTRGEDAVRRALARIDEAAGLAPGWSGISTTASGRC